MLGIPIATVFVLLSVVCMVLGFFDVALLGRTPDWVALGLACWACAWLAGGSV